MHERQHAVTLCRDWVYKIYVKIYLTFRIVTFLNAITSLFFSTYLPISLSPVSNSKMYFDGRHWCTTEELQDSEPVQSFNLGLLLCTCDVGWRPVHFAPPWSKSSLTEFSVSLQPSPAGRSNAWRRWGQNCHLLFVSWTLTFMTHDKAG